ncbi:MAG: sensor histidine kinase [Alphaproteobacteria bacterium]
MSTVESVAGAAAFSGVQPLVEIDVSVLEAIPAGVYICAADGRIVRFNRRAAELWGRVPRVGDSDERFSGAFRLYNPDGSVLPHASTPMKAALVTGKAQRNREVVVERPDGTRICALVNVEPLRNSVGEVTGAINCFQDITARKHAEKMRRDMERRYREMLDALPAAVYATDAEGTITYFNRAAAELAGRTPEIGKDKWSMSWRLFKADGSLLPLEECPMATALKEKRPVRGVEAFAVRPDGSRVPFLSHPTPLFDDAGQLAGAVDLLVDITERKKTESQRDLVVAELSHRVKNTLAAVVSIARQSFSKNPNIEVAKRSFDARLLALAQTHSRLAESNWSGVPLEMIVEDELAPFRSEDGRNLRISNASILLNPKCALTLGMAIHELVANAAKYGALSAKSGMVTIECEADDETGRFYVRWVESGGPQVKPPSHGGFGRLLLERAVASDLKGEVTLDFARDGLKCTISMPLKENVAHVN